MDKMFAKKRYKDGKFRPWMLRATPLVAITGILVFTAPTWVDGMGNLALMSISTVCVMPLSVVVLVLSPKLVQKMGTVNLIRKTLVIGAGNWCFWKRSITWMDWL